MLTTRAAWVLSVGFFAVLAPGCGRTDEQGGGSGGADNTMSGGTTSAGGGAASGGAASGGSHTATGGSGDSGDGDGDSGGDGGDDQGAGGNDGQPSGGLTGAGGSDNSTAYTVCDQEAGTENNPGCASGMICRVGYCTPACENNLFENTIGTGEDCPRTATGDPQIICGLGYCYLRCSDGVTCPDELVCQAGATPGIETCVSPAEAEPY